MILSFKHLFQKSGATLALLCLGLPAWAGKEPPQGMQQKIINLYTDGRCDEINTILGDVDPHKMRPNVIAIVAFCEIKGYDAEELFDFAERLNPTGDLILLLHGQYLWKKNKPTEEIWNKLVKVARNPYFREIAKNYSNGVYAKGEVAPLNLSPNTAMFQFSFSGVNKSNPQNPDFVYRDTRSTAGIQTKGDFSFLHWTRWGSLALKYSGGYDRYFDAPDYNLQTHNLESPIAVHITPTKDIIFKPLGSYYQLGSDPYKFVYGLAVAGMIYGSGNNQWAQGSIYTDNIFIPEIEDQAGSHYRFEYQWEFFPQSWFYYFNFFIEHTSAHDTGKLFGALGKFEMSHTDLGLILNLEKDLGRFTIGVKPQVVYRDDDDVSYYPRKRDGAIMSKTREDWDILLQSNLSFAITQNFQLYSWYEFRRVISNIDSEDYVNRNLKNDTFGLGLKTTFTTY